MQEPQKIWLIVKSKGNFSNIQYQGVTDDGEILFEMDAGMASVHMGHYLSIVHAIAFVQKNNFPCEAICSQSEIGILWVCRKIPSTRMNLWGKTYELHKRAASFLAHNEITVPIEWWDIKAERKKIADAHRGNKELDNQFKKIIGKY